MELSNFELVRYPSGQLLITRQDSKSSFRDVVGVYANEADAQQALERLTNRITGSDEMPPGLPLPRVA